MPLSTSSSDATSTRRTARRTLASVGIAAMLIGIVAGARPQLDYRQKVTGVDKNDFWQQKFQAGSDYDIVLTGDSRAYMGLVPEEIEDKLRGRRVLNFGFPGGGLAGGYLSHLPALLKPEGCRCLVFSITPSSLTSESVARNAYVEAAERKKSKPFRFQRWLDNVESADRLASVRLLDIAGRLAPKSIAPDMNFVHTHYHTSGWVENRVSRLEPDASSESYRTTFSNNQVRREYVDSFTRQVADYRRAGIVVIGFRMPVSPQLQEVERTRSGMDWSYFINSFGRAGGIWLGSFVDMGFKTFDGSHLTADDARRFSRTIADRLGIALECLAVTSRDM